MDIDEILLECGDTMDKSLEYLQKELRGIRTGRANTALLEYVKVEYYGSNTDLRELAAISVAESQQLLVKPFDPAAKNDIIKAIEAAELGLNPMAEGAAIRVTVPAPSADRRKQLVTQVKKMGEDAKVSCRNARRDSIKHIEATGSEQKLSDDEVDRAKSEVEDSTKSHVTKIEEMITRKVTEVEDV
ncbi:MAG: ribosome recycling factor [Phycisphaera sp.]|nr:ribosome recycling factor [Phycisphaera sp.]